MRTIASAIYSAFATCLFAILALITGVFILTLPGLENRRRVGAIGMRLYCLLARIPFHVKGLESLPQGPAVVVANHMSYLDGLVFTSALPPRFGFVIKIEASRVPVVGAVLRRMGADFVDRHDASRGSSDTRRLLRRIERGQSLGFFSEGSLSHKPGLRPFRLGAFLIAARAGVPVVPAAVDGTRGILPNRRWWMSRGHIHVRVMPPIVPKGRDREAALELRDRAWTTVRDALRPAEADPATLTATTDRPL